VAGIDKCVYRLSGVLCERGGLRRTLRLPVVVSAAASDLHGCANALAAILWLTILAAADCLFRCRISAAFSVFRNCVSRLSIPQRKKD